MPRDPRTYITVHDGMPEHPKVEQLSDAAFRLLVSTWCWCSRNRTDGKVAQASWSKRGTGRARKELLDAGLAVSIDGSVVMHDYLQHQRSAAEIDELAAKRREAGRKGGRATANGQASATANASASATANEQQNGSKTEAESETELTRHTSSKLMRDRFSEFWDVYPRRVAKAAAQRRWDTLINRGVDPDAIIAGARAYAQEKRGTDPQFIKQPDGWLLSGRWEDERTPNLLEDDGAWAR